MIAAVVIGSRICQSASAGQLLLWFLVISLAAPFAGYLVRAGRADVRKAIILGLTILLVVGVLIGTANAVPIANPCDTCRKLWPEWACMLSGCF